MTRLVLFFLLLASGAAFPAGLPHHVTINFDLSRNGMAFAKVQETLTRQGASYSITSEARLSGLFTLVNDGSVRRSSRGAVTADGLRPEEFRDERTGRQPFVARFNWEEKRLTLEHQGAREQLALDPNTHDRLSLAYTFAFHPVDPGQMQVFVTDGRKVSDYRYTFAGKETVTIPMGKVEALHLVREREPSGRGGEIWLATQHHLLPVRIRVIEKDGSVLEQAATRITY